jgi:LPS-assembly protein
VRAETLFGEHWPESGGWGQAWVDEAAPGRPASGQTLPPAPTGVETVFGQSWPEVGGWGNAWGDDEAPAAPIRDRRAPVPVPVAAAQPGAAPVAQPAPQPVAADDRAAAAQAPRSAQADGERPDAARQQPPGMRKGKARKFDTATEDSPIQLTADQVVHDRDLGIVTAAGRVEIIHEGRTLTADSISYNLKQDVMAASGSVTLIDPTGDVTFTDYFEITGDFKNGVAQEIRVLLADHSRIAALSAQRIGGERTEFNRAVYTACEPCRSDPKRSPIWTAKAERVAHNQSERTIEYRDAWIELGGVPIMYTPYLSHPDPTVKRQTGFLAPTAGMNSNLGASATIPYFWAISDNEDLTVSPRFFFPQTATTQRVGVEDTDTTIMKSVLLAAQHRWVGNGGETKTTASLTGDRNSGDMRGHIDARGQFDLNRTWRTGYQLQRTSSDNYSNLYGMRFESERPWLTTRPYLEGFGRRNYAMAEGYSFQGQRNTDDPGNSPLVLPHALYSYIGDPGWRGSFWTVDSDVLAYSRAEGTDAQRLSMESAWNLPWTTRFGEVYLLRASMRGDGYHANDLDSTVAGSQSATSGRAVPQVSLNWRMPFANSSGMPQTIEPMGMMAAGPNGGNPAKIPNEDSLSFALDENNVLRPNRLVGLDRVEGGVRGGYGLRWVGYPARGGAMTAQVAQGWRGHADSTFGRNSGFTENFSDYVGRVGFIPNSNLSLNSRARLDKDTGEMRSNVSSMNLGPPALRAGLSYAWVDQVRSDVGVIYPKRQYVLYSLSSALSQYWQVSGTTNYDLTDEGGNLGWTANMTYNDECFAFVTRMRRFNTTDETLLSGFDVTFNLVFKTLADVPINLF